MLQFIVDRHAIPCISEMFVCNQGYTWLALRDELLLSVIYEDNDVCHCICTAEFEWIALEYVDEGILEVTHA